MRHSLSYSQSFNLCIKILCIDNKDGIFMSRFPFFLMAVGSYLGIFGASRNETEIKDNAIRNSYYLLDLILS